MKITDAHAHIFPEAIARKAAGAIGGFYDGVEMWGDGTKEVLLANCGRAGVGRCFVHSVATSPKQVRHINDFIAQSAAGSGGRLVGFATMHPDFPDIAGELDRALEMGLVGVKLHPDMQLFAIDDPRAMRIYEEMAKRRMRLVAHTGDSRYDFSNPGRTAHVLRSFPEMKVQCAHFGGYSVWEEVFEQLEGLGAYTDTSSSFFCLDNDRAMRLIRFFGPEKCMFGSDYPMWDVRDELRRFDTLPLTEAERALILNGAADLFLAE